MPLLVIAVATLLVIGALCAPPVLAARRRKALRSRPFPAAWEAILRERVPQAALLPRDLGVRLREHIQVLVAEKAFIGCDGLQVTDEMRVTIAAQAALLVLGGRTHYFPELRQILVYPAAFIVDRVRAEPSGVMQEQRQVLSGESWSQGQVILSWEDVLAGAAVADDGRNVVIHEFAHQLDQETGRANGAPRLVTRERYARWSEVLGREFARLSHEAAWQVPSLFSYYGATDPGEFFAVVSEVFFEQAPRMALEYPELYRELREYYGVDPQSWPQGAPRTAAYT